MKPIAGVVFILFFVAAAPASAHHSFSAEFDATKRVVHTDGRPHTPADELEPLYNGDQTARWDGDTLVIDSIWLDERTWINANGWFHSQYTVEDPKVLTRPWTSSWSTYTLGSEDLIENFCTNNENIYQLRKLYEMEKAKAQ